jgi:hypothetical protein
MHGWCCHVLICSVRKIKHMDRGKEIDGDVEREKERERERERELESEKERRRE